MCLSLIIGRFEVVANTTASLLLVVITPHYVQVCVKYRLPAGAPDVPAKVVPLRLFASVYKGFVRR